MSEPPAIAQAARAHRAIRLIVLANFLLVGLFLILDRVGGSIVDSALRTAGLDNAVAWSVQVWIAGSTLFTTGLFAWALHKKRGGGSPSGRASRSLTLDGALLVAWWLTLTALCAYGFMLGMAG